MNANYIQSIIHQNQQLRQKIQKFHKLQDYIEALLQKCETLQIEKQKLIQQCSYPKFTNQNIQRQFQNLNIKYQQQIRMVILEHDSIMKRMQQQLKIIKTEYQRQITLNGQLKQYKHQLESNKVQLQERIKVLQIQMSSQVNKLEQSLLLTEKDYQGLLMKHEISQSQNLKQKQELVSQLYHLKAIVLRQQGRYIKELQLDKMKLKKQNEQLKIYNEQISKNSASRTKQLEQTIKQLKSQHQLKNDLLKQQMQVLRTKTIKYENKCQQFELDINSLIDQNIGLKRLSQDIKIDLNRCNFVLQEAEKQKCHLRQKIRQIDVFLKEQQQKNHKQICNERQLSLNFKNALKTKQLVISQKQREIKDLLDITEQIEHKYKIKQQQIIHLRNQLQQMMENFKNQVLKFQQKNNELKIQIDQNKIMSFQIQELQRNNQRLRNCLDESQTQNHKLKRQLSNPRAFNKQIQQKIHNLNLSFKRQKDTILDQHKKQLQKLRKACQFQINNKQIQLMRKLQYFQQELLRFK